MFHASRLWFVLVALVLLSAGCRRNHYYGYDYYADVELYWSIEGSDFESLCATYAIDSWEFSAIGPDRWTAEIDCYDAFGWNSDEEFYGLEEGVYTFQVTALDGGIPITTLQTLPEYFDSGPIHVVDIDFPSNDFL